MTERLIDGVYFGTQTKCAKDPVKRRYIQVRVTLIDAGETEREDDCHQGCTGNTTKVGQCFKNVRGGGDHMCMYTGRRVDQCNAKPRIFSAGSCGP